MRRFLTLVSLLCLAVPAGITITGCTRNPGANYCNGLGYGPKITDVATITLQPATTGLSMAFGQTRQLQSPTAKTCKGDSATVSTFTYGTTNNRLVDVSPSGSVCAGTWNRNTGGGIGDYTICAAPNPLPTTGGSPYQTAYVTASGQGITSNPVVIYVHAQVTSVSLVGPQSCLSQGTQWPTPLDVQACYSSNGQQYLLCAPSSVSSPVCPLAPGVGSVPVCSSALGTLSYSVGTPSIALINGETNLITADMPGTTAITASVAGSSSSAGYFSTCPPQSITISLNGQTSNTPITVTQGVTQNLNTSVLDTNGNKITGLSLDYQSTDPIDISVATGGGIGARYPGEASISAICQPSSCNPAPINLVGQFGTGLPISSNPITVRTPGTASNYLWFGAPGQSRYLVPIDLLTGTPGSTVRLPYVPNSIVMDKLATTLYLGSARELMVVSAASNTVTKEDGTVPGTVLTVSPNGTYVVINDPIRQVFYLYNTSGNSTSSYGGVGVAAEWTPDSKTLYIVDAASAGAGHSDTLYVYNQNTGWTTYDLSATGGATGLAITNPSVGAYLSGPQTVAHTWCPTGTAGNYATMAFYPQGDLVPVQTDAVAATTDGQHILGAAMAVGGPTVYDIGVTIPTGSCPAAVGGVLQPLLLTHTLNQAQLTQVSPSAINQVVASPASNLAFITYSGSTPGAELPYYVPGTGGNPGALNYITLTGGAAVTAPLAGTFSPDDKLFFVSTAGDNQIHFIDVPTLKDTQQYSPNLPACTPVSAGGNDTGCVYLGSDPVVPATVIAVKPRQTT